MQYGSYLNTCNTYIMDINMHQQLEIKLKIKKIV